MGREKKRGTSGNAKAFISRPKALKKLQLGLIEFRRLCILKGVYPRNPRKKLDGSDKTYYLRKDIEFLAHERLISTVREQHAHKKKVVKARAKRRLDTLKKLSLTTPRARLDHLVVERYPRFEDAIRELDDPLCIIALFANLPAERRVGVSPYRVKNCQRLLKEFCHLVAESRSLKRVFVSIKGFYFQARLCDVNVTWVTPHRFTQRIPNDVDFSVMLTFLELYECILAFVNFRLYTAKNLAYPPKISKVADANALELSSLLVENAPDDNDVLMGNDLPTEAEAKAMAPLSNNAVKEAEKVMLGVIEEDEEDEDQDGEEEDEDEEVGDARSGDAEDESSDEEDDNSADNDVEKEGNVVKEAKNDNQKEVEDVEDDKEEDSPTGVFAGKSVVLGREVPFIELQFTLKASGAVRVTREDDLPLTPNRLEGYTHWIVDRPAISGARDLSLEYVQPQYIFDSINAAMLLPTSLYAPGANLPPHLSPFLTAAHDGGYRPWFQDVLERIKGGDTSVIAEAAAVVYADGEAKAKKREHPADGPGEDRDTVCDDDNDANGGQGDTDMRESGDVVKPSGSAEDSSSDEDSDTDNKAQAAAEEDVEGEEEKVAEEKEEKLDKEGKEMATLMLSRKKLRKYKKVKGREQLDDAKKQKLTLKRQKLEEERNDLAKSKTKKRKKLHKSSVSS